VFVFLPIAKFFRPLHVISIYHIGKNGLVQRFLTFFVQKNIVGRYTIELVVD